MFIRGPSVAIAEAKPREASPDPGELEEVVWGGKVLVVV